MDYNKLWYSPYRDGKLAQAIFPVSLEETCMCVKKEQLEPLYGTNNWFRIERVWQGCLLPLTFILTIYLFI